LIDLISLAFQFDDIPTTAWFAQIAHRHCGNLSALFNATCICRRCRRRIVRGWALSAGDLQFTYDWKRSRWTNIPIGFQIGKVMRLGQQPVRWAINPQYNLKNDDDLVKWKLVFTFTLLVPSG